MDEQYFRNFTWNKKTVFLKLSSHAVSSLGPHDTQDKVPTPRRQLRWHTRLPQLWSETILLYHGGPNSPCVKFILWWQRSVQGSELGIQMGSTLHLFLNNPPMVAKGKETRRYWKKVKVTHPFRLRVQLHVRPFSTPWTSPWNSPGQNTGVGSLSHLQGIFPTQRLNLGLLHCRQILYQLSHKGSPRILEWVAYPFFSRSFQPRNWTGVSCIAGGFFTKWAIRESPRGY